MLRLAWVGLLSVSLSVRADLEPVGYNHPGLEVDLGVGLWAWPLPMDWDGDGDMDLVVSCPDVPHRGAYLFENPGGGRHPVFKPPVRLGGVLRNARLSWVNGQPRVLSAGEEWVKFLGKGFEARRRVHPGKIKVGEGRTRANQWHWVDFDGDGVVDLCAGVGYWGEYGWDDAYDAKGNWTRGPLRGYVYMIRNKGTNEKPTFEDPVRLAAGDGPVDVYGMPSPNFADFDGDGDLDLLCGEFLDGFTYFENTGTRMKPSYAPGKRLAHEGRPLAMDLCMITPTAVDWDADGDVDLVVGDEDGRVALVEHTGRVTRGLPEFLPPKYFRQQAKDLKFGALVTPVSADWDGDGDEDLIAGNSAGYIAFIENLDDGNPPKWAEPIRLRAGGRVLRHQAGPSGSIQGPCEAKWGYTTLSVADWDHDGLPDLVVNGIWGKVVWYRNTGEPTRPRLAAAQPVRVEWEGKTSKPAWTWWTPEPGTLVTQWRTTPVVVDWNRDGLNDLVMLDTEGYLAFFERAKREERLVLLPGRRVFKGGRFDARQRRDKKSEPGALLRLNTGHAGRSGRRKLCLVDWDGDGNLDLMVNSENVTLMRNAGTQEGITTFEDAGALSGHKLAGHTTSPTPMDWNRDGIPDLLVGAEDGRFYVIENPRSKKR